MIITFFYEIAIWLSTGLNILTGGNAYTSFSIRNYILKREGKRNLVWLIDGLFFWEDGHCRSSYKSRLLRVHADCDKAQFH